MKDVQTVNINNENAYPLPDETPFPKDNEHGDWICTVCGQPNTNSVDDGCEHCG